MIPAPKIDARSFQQLVSDARAKVAERCPEWTEHNVSDPGITLIEIFAWMTEILVYQANRLPDRAHIALLNMLDITLEAAEAAEADVRFEVPEEKSLPLTLPRGTTEVATEDDRIVFRLQHDFTIRPTPLAVCAVGGSGVRPVPRKVDPEKAFAFAESVRDDVAVPLVDDAIYLGFREPLDRLVLRVDVTAEQARGAGIQPDTPPLLWEASTTNDDWEEAEVLADTTAGFNASSGFVDLQMPNCTKKVLISGEELYWVRCRVVRVGPRGGRTPRYDAAPQINTISARPVGALLRAEHAMTVAAEQLGESDGTPGQRFSLRNTPVLKPRDGEDLEVEDPDRGWQTWQRCEGFSNSHRDDAHYRFDAAAGEVELGPSIRTTEGWLQHGRIPPRGSRLRITSYRYGGGEAGNVGPRTLNRPRHPIVGVVSVTNPVAASGGKDVESVPRAQERAALELRAGYRAVTAADFGFLAGEASGKVERVRCREPHARGRIEVHVLPAVPDPTGPLDFAALRADDETLKTVAEYLDQRRVAGTRVRVQSMALKCVTVGADVEVYTEAQPDDVKKRVEDALHRYLNPYVGGPDGRGWPWGADVVKADVTEVVRRVRGVQDVSWIGLYETDGRTGTTQPKPAGERIAVDADALVWSAKNWVRARPPVDPH